MIARYKLGHLHWIDSKLPTEEDITLLTDELGLSGAIIQDLSSDTDRDTIELHDNSLYIILHFPALRHTNNGDKAQEIDFFLKENTLLTNRYETIDPIHKLAKQFEVNEILDREHVGYNAGDLFFIVVRKLYKSVVHELEYIKKELGELKQHIFDGREDRMVTELSKLSVDLLLIEHTLASHRAVLEGYHRLSPLLFGEGHSEIAKRLEIEYEYVVNYANNLRQLLTEIRDTNDSLLTTKQNEITTSLTVMAFTTFPLTAIASIFGMNAINMPFIGDEFDFWLIIGLMAMVTFIFYIYFRIKRWL